MSAKLSPNAPPPGTIDSFCIDDPPDRPKALAINVNGIPAELRELPQWLNWGYEQRGTKWTKPPFQPNGQHAQSTNPKTWSSLGKALDALRKNPSKFNGVGFAFDENGPYVGVDLDHCFDADGKLCSWAAELVTTFGTYAEKSVSGDGVHLISRGELPEHLLRGKGTGRRKGPIEIYRNGRYFACSGHHLPGSPREITDCTPQLADLLAEICKPTEKPATKPTPPEPSSNGHGPTDSQILDKARGSKSGAKFQRLWAGDTSGYGSHSDADLALVSLLSFWTGPDEQRIDSLFRQSRLVRDKWTEREDYRSDTIGKVLGGKTEFYKWNGRGKAAASNDKPPGDYATAKPSNNASVWLTENRTDTANARRLAAAFGPDLRYVDPWDGKWLHWDGRRWAIDQQRTIDALAKKLAGELWRDVQQAIDREADAKLVQELIRYARASNGANGVRNTIALARSEPGIAILPEALDRDPWLLNCENGTLDLRTGKLQPHTREDYITKLAPVVFDSEADCPRWRKFLVDIFAGNAALIGFMRRLMGYTLTGRVAEHVLPTFYGVGSNGKSTLCTAFLDLMGEDYAIQGASDLLLVKKGEAHPTERADLHGKRLVACIETDDGRRLAEGLLKQITGGDKIRARRMREDFWQFSATHKIWLACNHKPIIRGTDHGIWRRIKLVPFTVVIADQDQDKELGDKLAEERSGILNWALLGCIQWQAEGLNDPPEVKAATGDYRNEMDVLGEFLAQRCYIDPAAFVGASDLYRVYREWAETAGEHAVNQTRFGSQLNERGYVAEKDGGKVRRLGLGLVVTQPT